MPRIELPEPAAITIGLKEALERRRSARSDDTGTPISLEEMGTLLGLALRKHAHGERRYYPSGGGLYPIETYLISTALETQLPAVYHYNPEAHALERLWDLPAGFKAKEIGRLPEKFEFSSMLVFTSVWQRSSAKYGDLAYLHALLEAGHMSENVLLVSTALGLSARPYAGFEDAQIAQLLDLHEDNEQTVHSVTLSKSYGADPSFSS